MLHFEGFSGFKIFLLAKSLKTFKTIYICNVKRNRIISLALLAVFILSSVGLYGASYVKLEDGKAKIELADSTLQWNAEHQDNSKEFRGSSSISLNDEILAVQYIALCYTQYQFVSRKVRNHQFLSYQQYTLSSKADVEYYLSFRSLII